MNIVPGRIYLSDLHKKQRKAEGQVIKDMTIAGLWTNVDPYNNLYVCAQEHNKVYKLDSDLTLYNFVLGQTHDYVDKTNTFCHN